MIEFMDEVENTVFESSKDIFESYISKIEVELRKKNNDYKELYNTNFELQNKYSKLNDILESENPKSLNEEELQALITISENRLLMKYIEYEEVFFAGFKEAIYYFNRMNMIKNNKTSEFQKLLDKYFDDMER